MLAEIPWKTVAEIRNSLGYLVKPELFTVKATLSVMNSESLCYAACPLVVNGNQCNGAITSDGYEWWNCDGCNMTFVACDYRYKIFVQLADSTGVIYATTSQEVGEEIFGQTARELYLVKYEKQDLAQYNKIVMGVQNCEYLLEVILNREAFSDESEALPMFTIVKVESLNPSAENRRPVRRTSVGMRTGFSDLETGFSDLEARLLQGVRNFSTGKCYQRC
jgi:replication factor A1